MNYDKDSIEFLPHPTKNKFQDITNVRFGRLVVLGFAGTINRQRCWWCECDCGAITRTSTAYLNSGNTRSCGCLQRDVTRQVNTIHGLSANHPAWNAWCGMKRRCYDTTFPKYATYGKRGIQVCQRWRDSFLNFIADMGDKPTKKHSIDRIGNNGHYSCGKCEDCLKHNWVANCHWGTSKEQSANTRRNRWLTLDGKTQLLNEWAISLGMSHSALIWRLDKAKWSIEKALTTPPRSYVKP